MPDESDEIQAMVDGLIQGDQQALVTLFCAIGSGSAG